MFIAIVQCECPTSSLIEINALCWSSGEDRDNVWPKSDTDNSTFRRNSNCTRFKARYSGLETHTQVSVILRV